MFSHAGTRLFANTYDNVVGKSSSGTPCSSAKKKRKKGFQRFMKNMRSVEVLAIGPERVRDYHY